MLGKLCRLDKHCGHSPADRFSAEHLLLHCSAEIPAESVRGFGEVYIKLAFEKVHDDEKQRAPKRCCCEASFEPGSYWSLK
jgi:hypothetical protein